jgi:hypothetical protein
MAWVWTFLGIYIVGFVLVLGFNLAIGPITPGLCLLRAAVWPVYIATGWPQGYPMPMD